jgi:hypothetical protein
MIGLLIDRERNTAAKKTRANTAAIIIMVILSIK